MFSSFSFDLIIVNANGVKSLLSLVLHILCRTNSKYWIKQIDELDDDNGKVVTVWTKEKRRNQLSLWEWVGSYHSLSIFFYFLFSCLIRWTT